MKVGPLFLLIFVLLLIFPAAAQSDCPALVQRALESVDSACQFLQRNQACYGHIQLKATLRAAAQEFVFESAGDIIEVDWLEKLELSALNDVEGLWGIALLRLQANLPDTLPGQNITLLVFGDVQLQNEARPFTKIQMRTSTQANVRARPSTESSVLRSFAPDVIVTATGRLADNSWIRVQIPGNPRGGWVSSALVTSAADLNTLNVVEAAESALSPMQAFTFQSGVGSGVCAEVPPSGILVQTPSRQTGKVTFSANGVQIQLGSTIFLQAQDGDSMIVTVIEGQASLTSAGSTQVVPEGTYSTIPLDNAGKASGAPSYPAPYNPTALAALPLDVGLLEPVELAEAPSEAELAAAIDQSVANLAGQPDASTRGARTSTEPDCDAQALLPVVHLYAVPSRDSEVIMELYQGAAIVVSGFTTIGWIRGGPVDGVVGNPLTWIPADEVQLLGACQSPPLLTNP